MARKKYETGGAVDESFPRDAVLGALRVCRHQFKLDADAFMAYLGSKLGFYRDCAEKGPSPNEEKRWVEETLTAIEELRSRLDDLPPIVHTEIQMPCLQRTNLKLNFEDFRRDLDGRLKEAWNLLVLAERGIQQGKKASPATIARDWIASDLVKKLVELTSGKMDHPQACEIVSTVLEAVGIKAGDAKYLQARIEAFDCEQAEKNSR